MEQKRGVLFLADPLRRSGSFSQLHMNTKALVFNEDERYLPQAQAALYRIRQECGWVCVAAGGSAVWIALALAAQLMVDRLALWMEPAPRKRSRQLLRIEAFARRNLSLIASEILLVNPSEEDVRALARGLGRSSELRCTENTLLHQKDLTGPWQGDLFSAQN